MPIGRALAPVFFRSNLFGAGLRARKDVVYSFEEGINGPRERVWPQEAWLAQLLILTLYIKLRGKRGGRVAL
jgi:hypothetical protein